MLHFDHFLATTELPDGVSMEELQALAHVESGSVPSDLPPQLSDLFNLYDAHCQETLNGRYGSTAKYWMIYIRLMELYHLLSRATRTGDYKLYIFVLPELMKVFFAFNHHNYARWLVVFHDRLLTMEESHPGITEAFEKGIISIRRTSKPFSRNPIDLTLEQTINADAANQLTGNLYLLLINIFFIHHEVSNYMAF